MASTVLGASDVRHDEKALAEPWGGLFAAAVALGDEEGLV
jgi:hypothetical protein